jgi:hypothetical protein
VKEAGGICFRFAVANYGSSGDSNPPPQAHTDNIHLLLLERIASMVRPQLHSILPHLQKTVVAGKGVVFLRGQPMKSDLVEDQCFQCLQTVFGEPFVKGVSKAIFETNEETRKLLRRINASVDHQITRKYGNIGMDQLKFLCAQLFC